MRRPSCPFSAYRRSPRGWPLVGVLLSGLLGLSLLTQREPASQDPPQPVCSEAQYRLEWIPEIKQAWLGERFEMELWVKDASPSLDMNEIEFVLEVSPGRVTIPDVGYSDPGEFIPEAFLVILDATHSETQTSAMYRIRAFTGGSHSVQGRLATLAFDAVCEGTAEIVLSSISASDSEGVSLESPTSLKGTLSIGFETTGLPWEGAYALPGENAAAKARPKQALEARFELDSWAAEEGPTGSL